MTNKDKLKEMVRRKKMGYIPEGLSPNYDENGRITPGTRGLGPEYLKDIKFIKMPPSKPAPKVKKKERYVPKPRNYKNLA